MNIELSSLQVKGNAILSENGMCGYCFVMVNPEPYSLSKNTIYTRFSEYSKALSKLGEDVYIHRIDLYQKEKTEPIAYFPYREDFINKAEYEYFKDREYFESYTVIGFFIDGLKSLSKSYLENIFRRDEALEKEDQYRLDNFKNAVENTISIFNKIQGTNVTELTEEGLRYFIYKQINGFNQDESIHTSIFDDNIQIGKNHYKIFSLNSSNQFKTEYPTLEPDETLVGRDNMYWGLYDEFGLTLNCNHVLHQVIYIPKQENVKEVIEFKKSKYERWKDYKAEIKQGFEVLNRFENDIDEHDKICYVHNNLMLFSSNKDEFDLVTKNISQKLSNKDIVPIEPKYEYAQYLFNACVLGRENELNYLKEKKSVDFYFLSSLKNASTLNVNYSNFKDDDTGYVFMDRVFRRPILKDVLDLNRKYITARNGMFFAPTGQGKSSSLLNLCQQLLLNNVKLVCVEFGESFAFLVELYKERAVQIKFKSDMPLGINPFNLLGKSITAVKITSITGFILKLWRKNLELVQSDGEFFVSLQKIVKDFYDINTEPSYHNFETFYHYVIDNWEEIKERQSLSDRFFEIDRFKLSLSQFIKGGMYGNVCQDNTDISSKISSADLVVYELTEIKKDPFLLSIVITSLEDTINDNILSDRGTLGGVIFEEFGETSELKDLFGGGDVLSSVAWIYQKIRKENGFIWTVLQNIKQLPKNQYTENIISNVQLMFCLQLNNKVANDIIEMFEITNQEHIDLMKSTRKQFDTNPKWSELFIRWDEHYATVVRQEFPQQKYFAFQTDGDDWKQMKDDFEKTKDMQLTIQNIIKEKSL